MSSRTFLTGVAAGAAAMCFLNIVGSTQQPPPSARSSDRDAEKAMADLEAKVARAQARKRQIEAQIGERLPIVTAVQPNGWALVVTPNGRAYTVGEDGTLVVVHDLLPGLDKKMCPRDFNLRCDMPEPGLMDAILDPTPAAEKP